MYNFPGGEIQWARFRNDVNEYENDEEMEFGKSINNHRSSMTFGTLRIKSKGLRVPHWHFNANEHGYLQQVFLIISASLKSLFALFHLSVKFHICKNK